MKTNLDLASLPWTVEGATPYVWQFERQNGWIVETNRCIDVPAVPAPVPGSVQNALRLAKLLPDWNIGQNYRQYEWIEHRHWIYRVHIPDEWMAAPGSRRLECLGLDYSGWVLVNGKEAGRFMGTHIPHCFDVTPYLKSSGNVLEIVFDQPPRWLGQFGFSSQMTEWKTRFNYTWDWSPRLVQAGIWDAIHLVVSDGCEFGAVHITTDLNLAGGAGVLDLQGPIYGNEAAAVLVTLVGDSGPILSQKYTPAQLAQGIRIDGLPVEAWWPNLEGAQPLYRLTCTLVDDQGRQHDRLDRQVGFKHVEWLPCAGAPAEADPWICAVNGRPIFLQGVNFAPLCATFADLRFEDYEKRLSQYHELGANLFRINACQFLEREWFYELCDRFGLMVWQEMPLTSSGMENWPPEDDASIAALAEITRSFVERRRHHVSLLLWSGGNELQGELDGRKTGIGKPCGLDHPMLKRIGEVVQALDPQHRYIPTSPVGPRAVAAAADFGKGLHWDVHAGAAMLTNMAEAEKYWAEDDALFRSEIYCPGASPEETIRKYAGEMEIFPPISATPYWSRLTTWWIDWDRLQAIYGKQPADLSEYVSLSQAHQARMLAREMYSCKVRFPACGGILLWSGHDTFPLAINSTLIDYDGNYKPSALAVSKVWRSPAGSGCFDPHTL